MSREAELRRIALAADDHGRSWEWEHAYPQRVTRVGDVVLVAECFEDQDSPSRFAEFIATFDPPTVLSLLDRLNDAAVVIERMANGASREECDPELSSLINFLLGGP